MVGQEVVVVRPLVEYVDGEPVESLLRETVADVVVAAGATSSVDGSTRPDGTEVSYSLAFPKSYDGRLRGCSVELFGELFSVVGDPRPHPGNCPTRWNMLVEVAKGDG